MKNKAVGILILAYSTKKVFLMKRNPNTSFGGVWGCVSGGVDNDESDIETLKREIIEELGDNFIDRIDPIRYAFTVELDKIIYTQYIGLTSLEFVPSAIFPNDENTEWKWFELDNLPKPIYRDIYDTIDIIKDFFIDK